MPYIIVNDKSKPWHYYSGDKSPFRFHGWVSTTSETDATKLDMLEANALMRGRPDLYAAGWKITPVAA